MKVKFKMHDPDFLFEYENIPDEVIQLVPGYMYHDKWFYGELNGDDTITSDGCTFPIKLCQCIQVIPVPQLKKYRVTYAYGEGRHLHTARVIVSAFNEEDAVKIVKKWWSKTKFHKVEEIK